MIRSARSGQDVTLAESPVPHASAADRRKHELPWQACQNPYADSGAIDSGKNGEQTPIAICPLLDRPNRMFPICPPPWGWAEHMQRLAKYFSAGRKFNAMRPGLLHNSPLFVHTLPAAVAADGKRHRGQRDCNRCQE
jgi:hypothetical protein